MGTLTVRREEFEGLSAEDLVHYKDLSEALRNFETAAIYNFMDRSGSQRQEYVCTVMEQLAQASELLFMVNGRINCGPLCPRGRSCVMCAWRVIVEAQDPTSA